MSTKYRVAIHKKIREQYNLKPGQKLLFLPYRNSLRIALVPPIEEGYGFLKGLDTNVDRECGE